MTVSKKSLAVVFGGNSSEHDISILSVKCVTKNISKKKYNVFPCYITKEGVWLSKNASKQVLNLDVENILKKDPKKLATTLETISNSAKKFSFDFRNIDVAFPLIHGSYGEDGTIQSVLESFSVPYIGCNSLACATTIDKGVCKKILSYDNIPTLPFIELSRWSLKDKMPSILKRVEKKLGFPVFVKPSKGGSSLGIRKISSSDKLVAAIKHAFKYDTKILIEKGLPSPQEIEVGILGCNEKYLISALGEIIPSGEFYNYKAKYISNTSLLNVPAKIPISLENKIKDLTISIAKTLGLDGLSRIDFLIDKKKKHVFFNEVNPIPGFTSSSMYPKMYEHIGISYTKLIDILINTAFKRPKKRNYATPRR